MFSPDIFERAYKIRSQMEKAALCLTDEQALNSPLLFPKWHSGLEYVAGDRILYEDVLYKVLQNHTSQEGWEPNNAPSLFATILTSITGEPLEWVQPDSTNPYMKGDKVIFEGQVYESLIDNNVWSPEAYPQGWQLIEE